MKVVCLLSGGLDSTVMVAKLLHEGHQVRCLSVFYGQRHRKEVQFAEVVAAHYKTPHEIVSLPSNLMTGSALTGGVDVPEGHYEDPSMRVTVVPARNLVLLSVATSVAVREGFDAVAYAAHSGDHAIYPDCRPTFISAMAEAMGRCDYRKIDLLTPFAGRTKSGIVADGDRLGVPFQLTWSCYKGGNSHCGKCATCYERREAFTNAGVPDPTLYEGRSV